MIAIRRHLGLLLSKDLTELGMQDAHSMHGRWCWLSAVSTARSVYPWSLQLNSLTTELLI